MTGKDFILLFFFALIFSAPQLHAQYNESLLIKNNQLLNVCEENIERIEDAFIASQVDSSFRNPTISQLKTIHQEAMLRRAFLYEARSTKNSTIARLFQAHELKLIDQRMVAEWNNYEAEMAYCQACNKICNLIPAFTNNKKVYYAEDKFFIPSKYYPMAQEVYKPMADSIFMVATMYPQTKFEVLIKTTGYADESNTAVGSVHYNDMAQRLQADSITNQEINNYISYLRSYDVAEILKKMIRDRENNQTKNVSFRFEADGKGTTLPDYNIRYQPIDEKRRIVEIYWHILPKF